MKQSSLLAALMALATMVFAATCSINLHFIRTESVVGDGDNSLTCTTTIDWVTNGNM
ncbi:hypothetical protein BDV12DRAFT_161603, partial [Aspergillus spectabilis]